MDLEKLGKIYHRETRSISPENLTGEKGQGGKTPLAQGSAKEAARELGDGWKVNPYIDIPAGETLVLADISGSGAINHIWMTLIIFITKMQMKKIRYVPIEIIRKRLMLKLAEL